MIFLKPVGLKLFNWLFPEVIPYIKGVGYAEHETEIQTLLDNRFEDGYKLARTQLVNHAKADFDQVHRSGFEEGYRIGYAEGCSVLAHDTLHNLARKDR